MMHLERRKQTDLIFELWDKLADFSIHEQDEATRYLMRRLCGLIDADDAYWVGLVRINDQINPSSLSRLKYVWPIESITAKDPTFGWRVGAFFRLNPRSPEEASRHYQEWKKIKDKMGDTSRALSLQHGHFRAHRLHDGLVDFEKFKKTDHYDFFYRKDQIEDRIWVIAPVSANSESCFVFDAKKMGRRFTDQELRVLSQCLRGIKWFHRQILMSRGLGICASTLAPRERTALHFLLCGDAEKEIAEKLGISAGSAHQYCTRIYRKFGVKGRIELMSLWVSN